MTKDGQHADFYPPGRQRVDPGSDKAVEDQPEHTHRYGRGRRIAETEAKI